MSQGTKRIRRDRPESEWVVYKSDELRIIPDELWDAVHADRRPNRLARGGRRGHYVLSGVLKCDLCGLSLVVQNSGRYSCHICNGYRNGGTSACPNNHRISRHVVENAFFDESKAVFVSPSILRTLKQKVERAIQARLTGRQDSIKQLQARKKALTSQLENLLRYVESGDHSETVRSRIAERESELRSVGLKLREASESRHANPSITTDWLLSKLGQIIDVLEAHREYAGMLKQEIRSLFPNSLVTE